MDAQACVICGNVALRTHLVCEMQIGLREQFRYRECLNCGCLQLMDVPADMSPYYPADYYSFGKFRDNPLRAFIRCRVAQQHFGRRNVIGAVAAALLGGSDYSAWFKACSVTCDSAILDVGCGSGKRIVKMHADGFRHVSGIDPYIDHDVVRDGVTIRKRHLHELDGEEYDLIMLHHSFEHMSQPRTVLKDIHRLVKPDGHVLIRIPVADGYGWRTWGVHWQGLDAPRHLFIHTRRSMEVLTSQSGFAVDEVSYDSTALQFCASEQYRRGIPLMDPRSYYVSPRKSIFSRRQIRRFKRKAGVLNRTGAGDTACFILSKLGEKPPGEREEESAGESSLGACRNTRTEKL